MFVKKNQLRETGKVAAKWENPLECFLPYATFPIFGPVFRFPVFTIFVYSYFYPVFGLIIITLSYI